MRKISESEGVPPFCKHASDVIEHTLDLDNSSSELVRIIVQDLGLTSQILRVANSAHYNRSERPILSVAHAVSLLGWDTVRKLVSTVRYVEHFAARSPGLREVLLLSVLTAVHSSHVAAVVGYPYPEEAYICGLFRNLGEVVIGCHLPLEYSAIILKMHTGKMPAGEASRGELGFTWDEVGLEVAKCWGMPASICECLRGAKAAAGSALHRSLASITDYSHNLTRARYRDGTGTESMVLQGVVNASGQQTLVSVRDLYRIADSALRETQKTFTALRIPAAGLALEHQAERARSILESVPTFDAESVRNLDRAVESAIRSMRLGDFELSEVIAGLLEAARTAGLDHAVFGLLSEDHTFVRGRLASGGDDILLNFQFPVARGERLFSAAFQRQTDILVDRSRDDRYDSSALVSTLRPSAFALLPVIVDHQAVGCLYVDRGHASPGFDGIRHSLSRVRDAVAAAIRRKSGRQEAPRNERLNTILTTL